MDNFLPIFSSNANSVQELSMDLNNNRSLFTTMPTYVHQPHHHQHLLQPPYSNVVAHHHQHLLQPPYSNVVAHHHQHLLPPPYSNVVARHQHQLLPPPYSNAVAHHHHSSEAFPQIPVRQPGSEFGSLVSNPGLRQESGRLLDRRMTKMARINRKNAMIRSRKNSRPNSSSSSNVLVNSRRRVVLNRKNNSKIAADKDLYRYSSFDNKKLRVLVVKHLMSSDLTSFGRIILPKGEAEINLSELSHKTGIILEMREVNSIQSWSFRYKFWINNNSRIYVLEKTGEYVKKNGIEIGDYLTIYEDESKNLYFSMTKSNTQNEGREDKSMKKKEMNYNEDAMFDYIPKDEEEESIAMLIENLNDHYPNDLMDLTIDFDQHHHQATSSSLPPVDHMTNPQQDGSDNDHLSLDDFLW